VFLEFVIDPACSLVFEGEQRGEGLMRRPPRDPRSALLSGRMLRSALAFAALIAASSLGAFGWALLHPRPGASVASTMAFMTLALAQLLHLGNARSTRHVSSLSRAMSNRWALGALLLGVAMQLAIPFSPVLSDVLGVARFTSGEWALVVAFGAVPAVLGQALRLARRRIADDEHRA